MGKGNGGTRNGVGGTAPAPVDEYAAWRAVEGSELYTYDRDKVKVEVSKPLVIDGAPIDGITPAMLRYKADYNIFSVPRSMKDGKYHIGTDSEYWYTEKMTFSQAINKVVEEEKKSYRYNERLRDRVMEIRSEDDNAPSAWIWVELRGNNKVRISIDRFKP